MENNQIAPSAPAPIESAPAWVRSAVFYQIFPDRFARSPRTVAAGRYAPWGAPPTEHSFSGGNLRGIQEHLEHICDLGANALYLCPIFSSTANHRYHTHDYFQIDPILGTPADFDALLQACHKKGVRVILDGVFNHCSRGFYPFNSVLELGEESPYREWFHIEGFPVNAYGRGKPNYACWWGIPALPKFNTSHPEVREFLMSVGEFWMRRGIDGWRLDVPNEIDDDDFWREFRQRMRAIQPEAYIVGEIWDDPSRWLQGDQFDGVMNYVARRAILDAFLPDRPLQYGEGDPAPLPHAGVSPADFATIQVARAQRLAGALEAAFPPERFGVPMNLLGSHDTLRLTTLATDNRPGIDPRKRNPKPKTDLPKVCPPEVLMAWALLFMLPGAPCIYYGDELGLHGGRDPDCRRCMPWETLPADFREREPYATLRALAQLRATDPILREGAFGCRPEGGGLFAWRERGAERLELFLAWPGALGVDLLEGEKHSQTLLQRGVRPFEKEGGGLIEPGGFLLRRRVLSGGFG